MADGTIVVCDALRAVGESLAAYLARDGLTVAAVVAAAEELLDAVAEYQPTLVLLDVAVARRYPGRLLAALNRTGSASVLMLGPVTATADAAEALRDGLQGWVPHRASGDELLEAVHAVRRGEFHMPPELVVGALRSTAMRSTTMRGTSMRGTPMHGTATSTDSARRDGSGATPARFGDADGATADARIAALAALGDRERTVLACLVEGMDRRGIAVRLRISENTVKTHIGRILAKLGAHSMLEAAAIARAAGLGDPAP
ncbi:response regulator transcription factor [Catenulispora yoronensis]|uniref:Response regulator transcription factor n=2 Tax=Catenulispora yoronensis TaxID=450799 RepID=A0ABP5FLY9_9ACTN